MLHPSAPPSQKTNGTIASLDGSLLNSARLGPSLEFGGGRLRARIALSFLIMSSAPGIAGGALRMAICAAVSFSALLAHELGHALCAVFWGSRATIMLHLLGAHTTIEPRLSRGRELVATLMGPVVSLVLGLLLVLTRHAYPGYAWLNIATWVNLVWGAVNLLPVVPFDGGRALLLLVGDKHRSTALLVSGCVASIIACEGLIVLRSAPIAFLFGAAALASLFGWSNQRRVEAESALELPEQLDRARALLSRGEAERARELATRVAVRARTNITANSAWELVAWAELELGRPEQAYGTLGRVGPAADVPSYCLAAVQAARGQTRHAISLLQRARPAREPQLEATKLLIDLHARMGSLDQACAVASAELRALDADDTRRVIEAAFEVNAFGPATKLAGELAALTGSPDDAVSHAYGLARLGDRTTAKQIFLQLVSLLSDWQMHRKTLARLRELAGRPDLSEIIGPELSHRALAPASPLG